VGTTATTRITERYLAALVEQSSDVIVAIDRDGRLLYVSPSIERMLGVRPEWQGLRDAFALIHPEDRARVELDFAATVAAHDSGEPIVFRMLHADGSWRHVEASGTNLLDDPEVNAILVNVRDVTARVEADAEARASEQRYQRLVDHSPQPIAIHQDGRLVYANQAAASLLGAEDPSVLVGREVAEIVGPDRVAAADARREWVEGEGMEAPVVQTELVRLDGSTVEIEVAAVPTLWEGRPAVQVIARDLEAQRRAEAELRHQAHHDSLTGLPNRDQMLERLRAAVAKYGRRRRRTFGVAFLDLDRFKVVNDALGHAVGDEVLVAVAERLRGALRASDTLSRFGGDEFVVLLEDVASAEVAEDCVRRLLATLHQPIIVAGRRIDVSCSAGLAMAGDATSAQGLLRDADTAMYAAKGLGRSQVRRFERALRAAAADRLDLEEDLRRGLEQGDVRPWFQPEVDVVTGRPVGAEALVRWHHPQRGVLRPAAFLAVAEDAGLTSQLTAAVLDPACTAAAEWRQRTGDGSLWISVNLTEADLLDERFADRVRHELARHDLPGDALCLEVTESSLIADPVAAARTLAALQASGVAIAIDDFGTGYSSLSYLKRFQPDYLKIDRSLVEGVATDPSDRALVRAAIDVAKALDIITIAEGVERPEQRCVLAELGCDLAQGYLLGRPSQQIPDADAASPAAHASLA
jgi:diguanylate cyclase (GGDEF)-like protein/PAS domain S-box-containing protein